MLPDYDEFLDGVVAAETAVGRQPNLINLIKLLREHSPMGLKDAKDIVDDYLQRRMESAPPPVVSPAPGVKDVDSWLRQRIAQLEAAHQKPVYISLIKDVREKTGLGLKEAKDSVDAFCARERPDIHGGKGSGLFSRLKKLWGLD